MDSPKISVIVPVYNVAKYLERCVDSILTQTFRDYEVLLIDDGSTDQSGELCDKYAKENACIRVIHKENGGLSDARNVGMDNARGEFISFVDSDDYIACNMLECLYFLAQENKADVVVCGTRDCYETGTRITSNQEIFMNFEGKEALRQAFVGKYFGMSVCNKLFHSELCQAYRFPKGKTSEDVFFTPYVIMGAKRVSFTSEPLYNYWHRKDSITTASFSEKNLDVIHGYEKALKMILKNIPEMEDVALFRLYWACFLVLDKIVLMPEYKKNVYYKPIIKYLRDNWRAILSCSSFQRTRRLSMLALKIHVDLYRLLVIIYNKKSMVND